MGSTSRTNSAPSSEISLAYVTQPGDPAVTALSELLERTLADPDTLLGSANVREFLTESNPERVFFVLVARRGDTVVGGSVFSYVIASNCGFSEYIVTGAEERGTGLGRRLFDARKAVLDARARMYGHDACSGLFIEVDSPARTPTALLDAERTSALDAWERLRIFDHLGFRRVEVQYVQPPLAPGKHAVEYLDLLFAPWAHPGDRLGGDVSEARSSFASVNQTAPGVGTQADGRPDRTPNQSPPGPSLEAIAARSETQDRTRNQSPPGPSLEAIAARSETRSRSAGDETIPARWVLETVAPIWRAWGPLAVAAGLARVRAEIGEGDVALVRAVE